jgi:hypothetical protein
MGQEQPERYNTALELHNHEFRTLGERSNLFTVIQSILIGALVLIMIGQEEFGYVFPYMVAGVSLVGAIMCFLQYKSGLSGSENAFLWRKYMLSIENAVGDTTSDNMPWKWFYDRYKGPGSLNKFPLPSVWLYTPTIFTLVWLIASAYIPGRIWFDTSFALSSNRQVALIVSFVICVGVLILFAFFIINCLRYRFCANKFTSLDSSRE